MCCCSSYIEYSLAGRKSAPEDMGCWSRRELPQVDPAADEMDPLTLFPHMLLLLVGHMADPGAADMDDDRPNEPCRWSRIR